MFERHQPLAMLRRLQRMGLLSRDEVEAKRKRLEER
jgi:hypothetical protein